MNQRTSIVLEPDHANIEDRSKMGDTKDNPIKLLG